jgi:DsbC/DsbD-like thiol-disulfide interchange protein
LRASRPHHILLFLSFTSLVYASIKPPAVSLTLPEVVYISVGTEARTVIKATVPTGFHVQSNPASEEYLIPTKLEFVTSDGLTVREITYPKGKPFRLKGSDSDISVYEGTFEMSVTFAAGKTVTVGEKVIKGKFTYQACDDKSCLRPVSAPFELLLRIEAVK